MTVSESLGEIRGKCEKLEKQGFVSHTWAADFCMVGVSFENSDKGSLTK